MADLTIQSITTVGTTLTFSSAAGGGDTFTNDKHERTFLYVKNGGGGGITVTFDVVPTSIDTAKFGTVDVSDNAVSVGAGADVAIGPFSSALYNNSSGKVSVSYSGVTSVTVAAVTVPVK